MSPVWPNWAIHCTLGNFSKPVATIILPKSSTFVGNFCKCSQNLSFGQLKHFWATFIDIWRLFTGHTGKYPKEKKRCYVPRREAFSYLLFWARGVFPKGIEKHFLAPFHPRKCLKNWKENASQVLGKLKGESPGLVVMGGDSCSEGRGFESQAPYTGWSFLIYLL